MDVPSGVTLPLVLLLTLPVCLASPSPAFAATPTLVLDVHDAVQPDPGSGFRPLGVFDDGRALIAAAGTGRGLEPWVTDGTAAGTHRLADVCPGPCHGVPVGISAGTGDRVYFLAAVSSQGLQRQLWVSDGTVAGTRGLPVELRGSVSRMATDRAGRVFLSGRDRLEDAVLWVSDGTAPGTLRLPHPAVPGAPPALFGGRLGDGVWFVAGTGVGGTQEPWVSDGTPAGTRRLVVGAAVAGPALGGVSSAAYRFAPLDDGGGAMVQALGGVGPGPGDPVDAAVAVWTTDGTPAGTRRTHVLDAQRLLSVDPPTGPPTFVTAGGDGLERRWTSDGTAAGSRQVLATAGEIGPGVWVDGRLFFTVLPADGVGWELWSHRPGAGTGLLGTFCPEDCTNVQPLQPFAGGVAFLTGARRRPELWRSDGTPAGTRRVAVLCEEDCGNHLSILPDAPPGTLFIALIRFDSWTLFASDGTAAGTRRVGPERFANVGPGGGVPVAGGVLLGADDGVHGHEPWVSDGTAAGTRLLANLALPVGNGDALPRGLTPWGERFLFFARDAEGWGVWRSDGSGAGTLRLHRLADGDRIDRDPVSHSPRPLLVVGDLFFFAQPADFASLADLKVVDLTRGRLRHLGRFPSRVPPGPAVPLAGGLLWAGESTLVVSDGTLEGSRTLPGVRQHVLDPAPVALDATTALFAAHRPTQDGAGTEFGLWRTDGTAEGTERIFAVPDVLSSPRELVVTGGGLALFSRALLGDGERRGQLWRTDGSEAGTLPLASFPAPSAFGTVEPHHLTVSGERVFFFVDRGEEGQELWLSDGTPGGTRPVARPRPEGLPLTAVQSTAPFAGGLFFVASHRWYGSEPWVSDGTEAGTVLLGDLLPGFGSSNPRALAVAGGRLFFVAPDGAGRFRLWVSDGTVAGTFPADPAGGPVRPTFTPEVLVVGDRVVYTGDSPETGSELWSLPVSGLTPPPPQPPPAPPAAPRGLSAVAADDGVVSLAWVPPERNDLYTWLVEARTPLTGEFRVIHQASSGLPTARLAGLPPGVPHTFRLRAVNAAGVSPPGGEAGAVPRPGAPEPCVPDDDHLCLLDDRFRVAVHWRDRRSGRHGRGVARPLPGSDRSGVFWFFRDANVELIVKLLDGTFVNRRWWLFTGGLTDLEHWLVVRDGDTGETGVYRQPGGDLCGLADTDAFAGAAAGAFPLPRRARTAAGSDGAPLELVGGRFRVEVSWRDPRSGDTGAGSPLPWSDTTGFFWFFHPQSVELVVKVLDGRPVNGRWWVFFGGLTDVAYEVRVTDAVSGGTTTYQHAAGDLCGRADTAAFPGP